MEESNENDFTSERSNWVDNQMQEAMTMMLPKASRDQYIKAYEKYQYWRKEKNLLGKTNEKELFAYLHHKFNTNKWVSDGTLWSRFSMLRSMILAKEGLNIKTTNVNSTIQTWLKRIGANHKIKQAHIFTKEEARKYIREAPDTLYCAKASPTSRRLYRPWV